MCKVVRKMSEKKIQRHYTLCQVYLFPYGDLCSKGFFFIFFPFGFWHDFASRMAGELSLGSSVSVLKLDSCNHLSLFLRPAWVHQFCPRRMARYAEVPPSKLIRSRWHRFGATKHGCMSDSPESRMLQNPSGNSRLQSWKNAIQSWELSPWKHMLSHENLVLQKKGEVKKKKAFSSCFTLILQEKSRTARTWRGRRGNDVFGW